MTNKQYPEPKHLVRYYCSCEVHQCLGAVVVVVLYLPCLVIEVCTVASTPTSLPEKTFTSFDAHYGCRSTSAFSGRAQTLQLFLSV